MRTLSFAISILIATTAAAQAVAQPPAPETLDTVLRGWEKAMGDLQSFACVAKRITTDRVVNAIDEYQGYAMFMKPQANGGMPRARLELAKEKSENFEKVIVTGGALYQYSPATKTIHVHNLPKGAKAADQESLLAFLFGMSAEQAKNRYDMKLEYPDGKAHPDYHIIHVAPRLDKDKADFVSAQLLLYRSNHLPARVWYLQRNKNTIEWNLTKIQTNVNIPVEKYFVFEDIPGWRTERGDKAAIGPAPRPGSK